MSNPYNNFITWYSAYLNNVKYYANLFGAYFWENVRDPFNNSQVTTDTPYTATSDEEDLNVGIKNPPIQEEGNVLKPAPQKIYPDNTSVTPFSTIVIPPSLPDIDYPKPPATNSGSFDSTFTHSYITPSLKDREYGCLLSRPFTNKDYNFCLYAENFDTFWEDLLTAMQFDIENTIEDFLKTGNKTAFAWAVSLFPLPLVEENLILLGTDAINKISDHYWKRNQNLNNYWSTGILTTGEIRITSCETQVNNLSEVEEYSLKDLEHVGIPLSSYDNTEGRKTDQIQIIWKSTNPSIKGERVITIPSLTLPTTVTEEQLREILPKKLLFGTRAIEIVIQLPAVEGWSQKFKTVCWLNRTDIETDENANNWFKEFYEPAYKLFNGTELNLSSLVLRSKPVENDYRFKEAEYYPYKALLLGWVDGHDPLNPNPKAEKVTNWVLRGKWSIFQTNPN